MYKRQNRPATPKMINRLVQHITLEEFTSIFGLIRKSTPVYWLNYFKNCEVPIICYKYNKPIRGAIFNFNKLVSDLNIETCTPDS